MRKIYHWLALALICAVCLMTTPIQHSEGAAAVLEMTGDTLKFEAECSQAVMTGAYEILSEMDGASGGKYVQVANGMPAQTDPNVSADGELYYPIRVAKSGVYHIWMRARCEDNGSDSFFFTTDEGTFTYDWLSLQGEWHWVKLSSAAFTAGTHYIRFNHREVKFKFDMFLITTDNSYAPVEFGDDVSQLPPAQYYNLPPIIPPAGHPRLFVRQEDLADIKANLHHPENEWAYNKLVGYANMELDGNLASLEAGLSGNVSLDEMLCAESNAFLYLIDKDPARGRKAIVNTCNYLSTVVIQPANVTRQGGAAIFLGAQVYDWCYDLLTDAEKTLIRKYMLVHASMTEAGWPPIKQTNVQDHTTEAILFRDLLSAGVALYDEDPNIYNAVAGRLFQEIIPSKNFLYQSLMFDQGVSYGSVRNFWELYAQAIFMGMGYDGVFSNNQRYLQYSQLYDRRPDGNLNTAGDNAQASAIGYDENPRTPMFLASSLYHDPYFKQEFLRCTDEAYNPVWVDYGISPAMHLIFNDVTISPRPSSDLPLVAYYGYPMGNINVRTSWDEGKNANTVVAKFGIQQQYIGNHQHLDSGHFSLYYKGALALDSGIYQSLPWVNENGATVSALGYGSTHDMRYHKNSIAHNTMLIYDPADKTTGYAAGFNDGGQSGRSSMTKAADLDDPYYTVGNVLSYGWGQDLREPDYVYLKGDITPAYSGRATQYIRTFMFLNFKDETYPAALLVYDTVESANKDFKKTWLLHSQQEPEIDGDTVTIRRDEYGYDGHLVCQTLLPKEGNRQLTKIGGAEHEFEVHGVNYKAVPNTALQESGNWRVELSPVSSARADQFLNVLQVGDGSADVPPIHSTLFQDDTYLGIKVRDKAVLLSRDGVARNEDIHINLPDNGEALQYIVTGLRAGKWQAWQGDTLIGEYGVEEGHDMLSFEAPSGTYRLTWKYANCVPKRDYKFYNHIDASAEKQTIVRMGNCYETFSNPPIVKDNLLLLPAAEYIKKLGYTANWSEDGRSCTIDVDGSLVVFTEGSQQAVVNGTIVTLETAPQKHEGVLYIPIVNIAAALKTTVTYDAFADSIRIVLPEAVLFKIEVSDDPRRVNPVHAEASGNNSDSNPYYTLDGNAGSMWAAEGDGQWIVYELEEATALSDVGILWNAGNLRKAFFEILTSSDGETFTPVYSGESNGKSTDIERYTLSDIAKDVKYVKIVGHGNTLNKMIAIKEIEFYRK